MLLFTLFFFLTTSAAAGTLPPDAASLLAFKSYADLDSKLLYTTNERFDFCHWRGVKCAQGRVVRYAVNSLALRGTVSAASLAGLDQLRVLSLRNNSLSGPIPDFSSLLNLKTLFLDHNRFSGEFPLSILFLHRLLILDLSHNNFTGSIPQNLTVLDRLGYLRLDSNRFSGEIPPLNQSTLELFNVSSNNLTGPIPVTPTLKKFRISSFAYNRDLCGEIINKPCRGYPFFNSPSDAAPPSSPLLQNAQSQPGITDISPPAEKRHHKIVGLILGLVTGALLVLAAVLSLVALIRKRKEENEERGEEIQSKIESNLGEEEGKPTSFISLQTNSEASESKKGKQPPRMMKSGNLTFCSGEEELYTLEQLMRASAELLGRGTIGTTYKAVMANQVVVSVKRLDACKTAITSGEAFEQHLECVGVLRHPNLVPLRAYFQAMQERLIIFDYHPNGSLFNLIHGMLLILAFYIWVLLILYN